MPLEEPLKNSLTMHTSFESADGWRENNSIQYETHMHLWNIALLIKQKYQPEYTNMNYAQ
jgi:hypothetical protein